MTFEGDSIKLRPVEPSDVDLLYRWENDTSLWCESATASPLSKYHLQQYIETSGDIYALRQLRMMMERKEDNESVGCIDLFDFEPRYGRAEVGILTDRKYQRNGYATEALALLEVYAFNYLSLHQLYAYVSERNAHSIQLFGNAGFKQVAKLKDWCRDETWSDCFLYQKIKPMEKRMSL